MHMALAVATPGTSPDSELLHGAAGGGRELVSSHVVFSQSHGWMWVQVDFSSCSAVGSGWRHLGEAAWPRLRKAQFSGCFRCSPDGAEDLMKVLKCCSFLEEAGFGLKPE